jgi:hypothetical protein
MFGLVNKLKPNKREKGLCFAKKIAVFGQNTVMFGYGNPGPRCFG